MDIWDKRSKPCHNKDIWIYGKHFQDQVITKTYGYIRNTFKTKLYQRYIETRRAFPRHLTLQPNDVLDQKKHLKLEVHSKNIVLCGTSTNYNS